MTMAPIDAYLDELLASEAPPARATGAHDAPPAPAIDPDLMAELMNDPALSGYVPAELAATASTPAAAVAGSAAPAGRARDVPPSPTTPAGADAPTGAPPTARARLPVVPDLSAFLPPAASPIAPVARTAVAAAAATTRTATGGHRWLRVCVDRDSYAFELLRVQEVVRVAPVVAMRGAAHSVLGVMNLRGRIVPVFDLGLWLDVGAVVADERSRVVVIERNDELIGVLVTAVDDVVSLDSGNMEPPLPGTHAGPTLGVARVGPSPTVLLDADALFD